MVVYLDFINKGFAPKANLNLFKELTMASSASMTKIQEAYVAFYGRPADAAGQAYWADRYEAEGWDAIVDAFGASAEATALYGAGGDEAQIQAIYNQMFGRDGDAEGVAFYTNLLATGAASASDIAARIFDGATGDDATMLANKVAVADKYTASVAANADAVYDDAAAARTFLSSVTASTVVADVDTDAAVAADLVTASGQTFTLTAGTDSITGTAADESIAAVNSAAIAEGTLSAKDSIDGGDGSDTFKVEMQKNWTGFTTGKMENVEAVELTSKTNAALSYAATGSTGVTSYKVVDAEADVTLSDLDVLASMDISGPADTSTFSAAYGAASTVATGSQTDTQNITLTDVGTIDADGVGGTKTAKFMTIDIDKVEALNITTAGTANSIDLSASADVKTVTIAGAGTTEVNAIDDSTTSFDASGASGTVIATLTGAATDKLKTVKSGAGDDTITLSMDDVTTTGTLEGGAGTDKLVVSAATDTVQTKMSGFETLELSTVTAVNGLIFSGTNVSDLETISVKAGALAGNASFVNMGASALTVATSGATTGNTISADNSGAITVNMGATSTQTAQADFQSSLTFNNASALTVNVGELMKYSTGTITTLTTGEATVNVAAKTVSAVETTEFAGTLTADTASKLVVDASGQVNAATFNVAKATAVEITTGSVENSTIAELGADEATSLKITAGKGLDMENGGTTNLAKVQTLTATTAGHLDFTGVDLGDAATVTVDGTNDDSQATFDALGATDQTYNLSLTADGLKGGLTTGAIDAGTGSVTIDISDVTGTVLLDQIDGDAGITITGTNLSGGFTNANNLTANGGDIVVDLTNASKAVDINDLLAGEKGDVTVTATNAASTVEVGVITGDNVTINGQNALGAVTIDGVNTTDGTDEVTAKTSFTYTATNLFDNGLDVGTSANSTAFTATLNGGAKNEVIQIDGNTKQSSITVKGDVGAGTNSLAVNLADTATATTDVTVDLSGYKGSDKATTTTTTTLTAEATNNITFKGSAMNDTIVMDAGSTKTISITDSTTSDSDNLQLDASGGATTLTKLSLSGIEKVTVDTANLVTINASGISGKAIDFIGDAASSALALTGTAGVDVIDLSKATTSSANQVDFTVTGSAGNDTVVLSTAGVSVETLKFVDSNGKDTITAFKVGEDLIDFTAMADIAANTDVACAAADAAAKVGVDDNVFVYATSADNGAGDDAVTDFTNTTQLAAYFEGSVTATDAHQYLAVINDANNAGKAYVYFIDVDAVSAAANTIEAGDITLIGDITADVAITTVEFV
jgi:S-layer protein